MLDRVTGMHVFARVAALGSLSAAARVLGMSQTMATKHIAALEERIGVKLVHRSTRRLTLTDAGRGYLDAVERILSEIDEAEAAASASRLEVRGSLRLNAPVSFGLREIAPLLPVIARQYPDLVIDLGLNDRYVDLIEEGWDLVIRIGTLEGAGITARRLAPCRTVVCASPSYLAAHGTPAKVADLARHNCLRYTLARSFGADRWMFEGGASVEIKGSIKANNGDALVTAAVAGEGIIYPPTFIVAHEIAGGRLVPLVLDHPPLELGGVYAVYLSDRRLPAKVRAVIDFLTARFSPVAPWDR